MSKQIVRITLNRKDDDILYAFGGHIRAKYELERMT